VRAALVDDAVARNELTDPVRHLYRAEADDLASDVASGEFADFAGEPEAMVADLAAVVTRRAGRAARAAAEIWDGNAIGRSLLEASPNLWSHGSSAVGDARDGCLAWHRRLEETVAPIAGRWFRARRTRALVRALATAALDPQRRPGGRIARRLDRIPGALGAVRQELIGALREVLEIDSGRFLAVVGAGPPPGILGRLTIDDRAPG
jgi:hypothetical protein